MDKWQEPVHRIRNLLQELVGLSETMSISETIAVFDKINRINKHLIQLETILNLKKVQ